MLKRTFVSIGFAAACVAPARGQTASDSVQAVVRQALDQLESRDTSITPTIFTTAANLVLVSYAGDSTVLRTVPVRASLASLNAAGPRRREELLAPRVVIDSGLATVIGQYRFSFDGVLHHCGVAMYDLVRLREGWRIAGIRETDRRTGCTP